MHSQKNYRRDFIKKATFASASIVATSGFAACAWKDYRSDGKEFPGTVQKDETLLSKLIVPLINGIKINGVFLDEKCHDILHQNWSEAEWNLNIQNMQPIGIQSDSAFLQQ